MQPGVSTGELERICRRYIIEDLQATPALLGHQGFSSSICTSINHVVCHAESHGYSVVREYGGHGIGRQMREELQVLHYDKPNTGLALKS